MAKRGRAFVIEIVSDSKKAQKGFNQFSSSFKGALTAIGATVGAREITQFVGDSIMAAAALENLVGGTTRLFGAYADEAIAAAEAANKIGLSDAQYLNQLNYFGNLTQAIGYTEEASLGISQEFINLGADFAAFFDAKPDQVIDALASATRGEYDALQRYLPTISAARIEEEKLNVIRESAVPLTEDQAKIQAILNIAYEDGGAAIGAYAAEADQLGPTLDRLASYAQDAKAAFGAGLVESLNDAAGSADKAGDAMIKLGDSGGNLAGGYLGRELGRISDATRIFSSETSIADKAQHGWNVTVASAAAALPLLIPMVDKLTVANVEAGASTAEFHSETTILDKAVQVATDHFGDWQQAAADLGGEFDTIDVKIDEVYASTLDVFELQSYLNQVNLNKLRAEWNSALGRVEAYKQALRDAEALQRFFGGAASGQAPPSLEPQMMSAGPLVTVNINGVVGDPVEAGRAIKDSLSAYENARGGF